MQILKFRLLIVNPIRTRYFAEVGDVVVGKVIELSNKKWVVNIDSNTEASLHLNSTYLPEQVSKIINIYLYLHIIFLF